MKKYTLLVYILIISISGNISLFGQDSGTGESNKKAYEMFRKVFLEEDKSKKNKLIEKLYALYPNSEYSLIYKSIDAIDEEIKEDKHLKGLEILKQAETLNPDLLELNYTLSIFYHDLYVLNNQNRENYTKEMVRYAERTIELGLSKAAHLKKKQGFIIGALCEGYYEQGEYAKSITNCNEAIKLKHDLPGMYYIKGLAKWAQEDNHGALSELDTAISLDSKNSGYFYHRARIKQDMKDFKGALVDAKKAHEMAKDHNPYLILVGKLKIMTMQKKDGCLDLSKANETDESGEVLKLIQELCGN